MFKARTRAAALTAIMVALLAPIAEAKTTRPYHAKLLNAIMQTDNGYPGIGGTALLAGSVDNTRFGSGAVVDHVTITGQPASNVVTFKGREVAYFAHGIQRSAMGGYVKVESDGSQSIVIDGHFTGGSGRYKGTSGLYAFKGVAPPDSTVVTGTSSGSAYY
jgi:hypothetical protein